VQDEELVARARSGDDEALDALLRRHEPLARRHARAHFLTGADHDDVVQEAMIGLYLAVRGFDPDRGASFRSFADVCVARQLVTAIRTATRRKHGPLNDYVSLHRPVGDDDGDSRTLGDTLCAPALADPAEQLVAAESVVELQRHVRRVLSDLEVDVLRLHADGVGYREIAGRLRRGAKSVDNALQRIRRKVEDHVVARELEVA
jgi:RNA polymerase sporulation-specific sigma factor